jgi:hypothetical protein
MIRRSLLLVALVAAAVALPGLEWDEEGTLAVRTVAIPVGAADAWESPVLYTEALAVGLSWEADPPAGAAVQVLDGDGWSDWIEIGLGEEHGPDPDHPEGNRTASDPVYVGEGVQAVRYRVAGSAEVSAELVEHEPEGFGRGMARKVGSIRLRLQPGASASPEQPTIVPRAAWNTDGCISNITDDTHLLPRVRVAFVHHTTGSVSNSYAWVRAICRYHTVANGWDDIGYNFLVAADGTIFEGRAGGIDRAIRGGHTAGFNSYSTGVAILGDYSGSAPSAAALASLRRLLAWKLDVHHVDPTSTVALPSLGNAKFAEGMAVSLPAVSGHRDAQATTCPGNACYQLLPSIRTGVDALGGARIFLSGPDTVVGSQLRGYAPTTIRADFTETMDWAFRILDPAGETVVSHSGRGTSASVTWDGTAGGQPVAQGDYRIRIDATTSSGPAPRAVDEVLRLGSGFRDVSGVHALDIERLADLDITRGCNPPVNDRFCPHDLVTRGEVAAFVARLLDLPPAAGNTFVDDDGSVFERDIERVAARGILRGCNPPANTRVCPDANLTRGEMAAVLSRALGLPPGSDAFVDDDGHLFEGDIDRLAESGITRGCNPPTNDRFCPNEPVQRQQMASFLVRAHGWLGG